MVTDYKKNLHDYLVEETSDHWKLKLPFIAPDYIASDIEQVLELHRDNKNFRLELNLIPEFPMGIDEYQAHEKSVIGIFQRIIERRFHINLFVVSGISHYMILQNSENEYVRWDKFLEHVVLINQEQFHSYHASYIGADIIKQISLVMTDRSFDEIRDEIESATFEYEYYEAGSDRKKIPAYSVKLPIGSIIHMTLRP